MNERCMHACTVEVVKTTVCVPSKLPYMGSGCIIEVDCMFCAVCMVVIFGARKAGCFRGGFLIEWPLDHRRVPLCLSLMRWMSTTASWLFQCTCREQRLYSELELVCTHQHLHCMSVTSPN